MDRITSLSIVMAVLCTQLLAENENFCKPLEDYGPREDLMESRHVCRTELKKNCQDVAESGCMEVTELRCDVMLVTNCTMNWSNKEKVESVMSVKERYLKNCTKEMVREYHNKTVYECRNVTKVHCTTLWTMDATGQKVWAGNEDDCKDVTWEECFPLVKQVPMSVAQMTCDEYPVSYFDYENVTTEAMADSMDCQVSKIPVCSPITLTKCDDVTYKKCEEVPETVCTTLDIPVPAQNTLHKQWCLFDQEENIDFDRQVRKITEFVNTEQQNSTRNAEQQNSTRNAEQQNSPQNSTYNTNYSTQTPETARSARQSNLDKLSPQVENLVVDLDPIFTDFTLQEDADAAESTIPLKRKAVLKPRHYKGRQVANHAEK